MHCTTKRFPDELKKTFVFSDLKMHWNKDTRSYTSGGKIGVGNINKTQVNKFVDGRIEIIKKRGGDILNIYLELDPNLPLEVYERVSLFHFIFKSEKTNVFFNSSGNFL